VSFAAAYRDEDELRDAREFFRALDLEAAELPDVSEPRDEWRPDNRPVGRIGRRNASTYIESD